MRECRCLQSNSHATVPRCHHSRGAAGEFLLSLPLKHASNGGDFSKSHRADKSSQRAYRGRTINVATSGGQTVADDGVAPRLAFVSARAPACQMGGVPCSKILAKKSASGCHGSRRLSLHGCQLAGALRAGRVLAAKIGMSRYADERAPKAKLLLPLNSKVFELRTGFQFLSQPHGLRSTSCPRVARSVAVFDRDLPTFQ
jgi:hypothetical protein